jgi:transmembrane sensor
MPPHSDHPTPVELKQTAIEWLLRLRADDMSDEEMSAFAAWLAEDYRHSEAFASTEDLFDDMVRAATLNAASTISTPADTAKTLSSPPKLKPSPRQRFPVKNWLPAAFAMAAVWLFAVILVMPEHAHPIVSLLSDYHTETGEIRDIQLADGSHILLNTNSAISVNFDDSRRQIVLHYGQARFTVAKDSQRPFEVVADDLNARALGTVFEVYRPDRDQVSVTVQQHAVRVDLHDDHQTVASAINLQAGQRLQYRHNGKAPAIEAIDLAQVTAWQQGRLQINDRPLGELIAELNRYRVGRIFLADAQLSQLRVTGAFALDNPDTIIRSVAEVLGLRQTRLSNWWVLLHR